MSWQIYFAGKIKQELLAGLLDRFPSIFLQLQVFANLHSDVDPQDVAHHDVNDNLIQPTFLEVRKNVREKNLPITSVLIIFISAKYQALLCFRSKA